MRRILSPFFGRNLWEESPAGYVPGYMLGMYTVGICLSPPWFVGRSPASRVGHAPLLGPLCTPTGLTVLHFQPRC